MDLDFLVDGEVGVTMTDYLKKLLSEFLDTIQVIFTTTSAEHIFTAREDSNGKLLDEDLYTAFRHSVVQLLFGTPHIRKDIYTDV